MSGEGAVLKERIADRKVHLAEVERRVKKAPHKRKQDLYEAAARRAKQEIKDMEAELKRLETGRNTEESD